MEPKWRDSRETIPDCNREIWVWDNKERNKFFVRLRDAGEFNCFYRGSEYPLWAYVWEIE